MGIGLRRGVNTVNAAENFRKASGLIKMHYDLKFRYEAIADAGEYRSEAGKSDARSIRSNLLNCDIASPNLSMRTWQMREVYYVIGPRRD